jgi:peptide/nickel transport system substrate-binding protein
MKSGSRSIRAVSRAVVSVIIIVILVVVAIGAVFATSRSTTTSTTSTSQTFTSTTSPVSSSSAPSTSSQSSISTTSLSSTTSSSSSTSATSSSSASSTTNSSSPFHNTLVIDDALWPSNDFGGMWLPAYSYPVWWEYDVYQTLVNYNVKAEYAGQGYNYLPSLAQNWTTNSNGTIWTFNLRQNVTFSNGDKFNAYQVWFVFYAEYYGCGNCSAVLYAYNTVLNTSNVIFGPATFQVLNQSGGLNDPSPAALAIMQNTSWPIYTTGPYQLVFHLTQPFLYLLSVLGGLDSLIYDGQFLLDHNALAPIGTPNFAYTTSNPIPGTGPYSINSYSENNWVKFVQNPTYWGKSLNQSEINADPLLDPGHAANVIIYYKADDISRYTDLVTGAAQISTIESQDWNLISSNPSTYSWVSFPPGANILEVIAFNNLLYPTNITDFRLAVVHAINYSDINQTVFAGQLRSFFGPITPGFPQYYDLGNYSQYSYNVTLAEQYLNESGFNTSTTLNFPLGCCVSIQSNTAQIIQADLAAIGININIEEESYSTFLTPTYETYNQRYANPAQLGSIYFQGIPSFGMNDEGPAENWISFLASEGYDWGMYNTTLSEQVAHEFWITNNITQIQSLLAQGQAQVYQQAPYIWLGTLGLVYGDGSVAWKSSVISGAYFDPLWSGGDTTVLFNTVTFAS